MQSRNEAAGVNLAGAAGSVTESDDVGTGLLQAGSKRQVFRPIRQRNESGVTVAVVAHEDRELSTRLQH